MEGFYVIIDYLKYIAFYCWGTYSFFVVLGLIGYCYKPKSGNLRSKNIEFVIVSVAKKSVKNALLECIEHTRSKFHDMRVTLLVDEGAELLSELMELAKMKQIEVNSGNGLVTLAPFIAMAPSMTTLSEMQILVVPETYRKDLVGKGRAINYFIENNVHDHKWYSFIDDDNLVLDDKFLYEIPEYEEMGYVACNPTIVHREGKSKLAFVMDIVRMMDDLTIFRFFTGLAKRPMLGMHGEMLTVKGSALKEIGYSRRTITEDYLFSTGMVERGMKSWQSASKISIKSPNDIHDLFKQRGRWFKGIAADLARTSPLIKILVGSRMALWILGVFGSWALSPLWLFWQSDMYLFLIGGTYPWIIFIVGIVKLRQPLYYILFIPAYGILESVSAWFGMRHKKFVVIDKN